MRFFPALPILGAWLALAGFTSAADILELKSRITHPPEMGEVLSFDVSSPLGEFTFRPPLGWKLEANAAARRFTLHSPAYDAHLEVRFAGVNPALTPELKPEDLDQQVAQRFPGASIREHLTSFTSVASGPAFDLDWRAAQGLRVAVRFALVPCPRGTLEFCLTTSPEKFQELLPVMGAVLTSFAKAPEPEKPGR